MLSREIHQLFPHQYNIIRGASHNSGTCHHLQKYKYATGDSTRRELGVTLREVEELEEGELEDTEEIPEENLAEETKLNPPHQTSNKEEISDDATEVMAFVDPLDEDEQTLFVRGASPISSQPSSIERGLLWNSCSGSSTDCSPRKEVNPTNRRKRKHDVPCSYYLKGKCKKGRSCPYIHKGAESTDRVLRPLDSLKPEVCKFYVINRCAKGAQCPYMHQEFPCKYIHGGFKCPFQSKCKFSHGKLTGHLRKVLVKHLQSAPRNLLGDFASRRNAALTRLNNIPSLMDARVSTPSRQDTNNSLPSLLNMKIPVPLALLKDKSTCTSDDGSGSRSEASGSGDSSPSKVRRTCSEQTDEDQPSEENNHHQTQRSLNIYQLRSQLGKKLPENCQLETTSIASQCNLSGRSPSVSELQERIPVDMCVLPAAECEDSKYCSDDAAEDGYSSEDDAGMLSRVLHKLNTQVEPCCSFLHTMYGKLQHGSTQKKNQTFHLSVAHFHLLERIELCAAQVGQKEVLVQDRYSSNQTQIHGLEIEASLSSHPPLEYVVVPITYTRPCYYNMDLSEVNPFDPRYLRVRDQRYRLGSASIISTRDPRWKRNYQSE